MTLQYYNIKYRKEDRTIKAITIRFSDKLHKAIKYKLVEDDKSIQEYVISLIKKDLNFTDEMDDLTDYLPKKK